MVKRTLKHFWLKLVLLILFFPVEVSAKITLPQIFGDNMVLQQKSKAAIWGKSKAGAMLLLQTSWNKKSYQVTTGTDGNFKVFVQTPNAGGPYQIKITGDGSLTIANVLIGEVWICSGQSNMEMPVKGFLNQPVLNSNDYLLEAENANIRLFKVNLTRTAHPARDFTSTGWQQASAATVGDFSAVAYLYAKILNQTLHVPVGVIVSAVGATKIQSWMSRESLGAFSAVKLRKYGDTATVVKNDPTVLFNGMINPLIGYGIRGVLWYQGEGNRTDYTWYDKWLAAMVADWRSRWNIGEWPFYFVQIAPWKYTVKDEESVPRLREAQAKAALAIPNCGMVVTIDIGKEKTIHPPDKFTVSKRLAYWALSKTYHVQGLRYQSPSYQSMKINRDTVTVYVDQAPDGLSSFDHELSAFELAGDDHIFYPAKAKILPKGGVALYCHMVNKPIAVRYAFKDWVIGDLYNTAGLPVSPFRTDSLPEKSKNK